MCWRLRLEVGCYSICKWWMENNGKHIWDISTQVPNPMALPEISPWQWKTNFRGVGAPLYTPNQGTIIIISTMNPQCWVCVVPCCSMMPSCRRPSTWVYDRNLNPSTWSTNRCFKPPEILLQTSIKATMNPQGFPCCIPNSNMITTGTWARHSTVCHERPSILHNSINPYVPQEIDTIKAAMNPHHSSWQIPTSYMVYTCRGCNLLLLIQRPGVRFEHWKVSHGIYIASITSPMDHKFLTQRIPGCNVPRAFRSVLWHKNPTCRPWHKPMYQAQPL